MLGKRNRFPTMEIKDKDNNSYSLKINFKFLMNLSDMLKSQKEENYNPIDYINNISEAIDNKDIDELRRVLFRIFYCMSNGKMNTQSLDELVDMYVGSSDLLNILLNNILTELGEEDIFQDEEDNDNDNSNKSEESIERDPNKDFINFWDYSYYIALYQLKLSEKEFYNSTPREINTLGKLHRNYLKGIILERDIDLAKAQSRAEENNNSNKTGNKQIVEVGGICDLF